MASVVSARAAFMAAHDSLSDITNVSTGLGESGPRTLPISRRRAKNRSTNCRT